MNLLTEKDLHDIGRGSSWCEAVKVHVIGFWYLYSDMSRTIKSSWIIGWLCYWHGLHAIKKVKNLLIARYIWELNKLLKDLFSYIFNHIFGSTLVFNHIFSSTLVFNHIFGSYLVFNHIFGSFLWVT